MSQGVCLTEPFWRKAWRETPVVVLKLDSDRTTGGYTRIAETATINKNRQNIPVIPIL